MGKFENLYNKKENGYYDHVRFEIDPLMPSSADRILEIGFGEGSTLSYLKSSNRCIWVGGIELSHAAVEKARQKNLDLVLEGNIEDEDIDLPFEENYVDVIIVLDVLEHLVDPWSVIHRCHTLLKPGGSLICSIPNVRNFKVVLPLLSGKWQYSDTGILDKSHLRFFTKKTAIELMECSGMNVDMVRSTGLATGKSAIANILTMSLLKQFFEVQYIIRAKKDVRNEHRNE